MKNEPLKLIEDLVYLCFWSSRQTLGKFLQFPAIACLDEDFLQSVNTLLRHVLTYQNPARLEAEQTVGGNALMKHIYCGLLGVREKCVCDFYRVSCPEMTAWSAFSLSNPSSGSTLATQSNGSGSQRHVKYPVISVTLFSGRRQFPCSGACMHVHSCVCMHQECVCVCVSRTTLALAP